MRAFGSAAESDLPEARRGWAQWGLQVGAWDEGMRSQEKDDDEDEQIDLEQAQFQ